MKVVLDTNVLVSGISRPERAPGRIVSGWLQGRFELVLSEAMMDEFKRVLEYRKIRKLLAAAGISDDDLRDYLDILRMKAVLVTPDRVSLQVVPADPKDIPVLEAFVASGAEFLVTGDKKHLLAMGMDGIVSASDFLARLQSFESLTLRSPPTVEYLPKRRRNPPTTPPRTRTA